MSINILLIESDEPCIKEIKSTLDKEDYDFKIDQALTLKEGLQKLEHCAGLDDPLYDVIILDLSLPNGEGFKVFNKVVEECKRIPIVVVSKYEDQALKCVKNGAQDYLLKPYHLKILSKSLKYSIERFNLDRRYYQLVESTNAAIYEIDFVNQTFTYVNDMMCKYTGYSKSELLNMNPFDMLTRSSQILFRRRLDMLAKGKYIDNTEEFQIIRKDGKKRWALITADYIIKDDIPVGARVVALDVTDKKRKHSLLQSIFDHSPVALGILDYADGDRVITSINKSMCTMLGYTEEEIIGHSALKIYKSKEEFDRVGKIKYGKILQGKRATIETTWKKKNGEIIDILLSTAPLDSKDPYSYSVFIALDVTEERRNARLLNDELDTKINEWKKEVEDVRSKPQLDLLSHIIEGN